MGTPGNSEVSAVDRPVRQATFDPTRFEQAYPQGIERSWWHIARNRVIGRAIDKYLSKGAFAIEVGCGTGVVTDYLRRHGVDVTGVELGHPRTPALCPEHQMLGQDAILLPQEMRVRCTALLLFDVIEHMADAPAFLRNLLAAYPNAHHVIVTVPARKELWTTFDSHFGHFRRYDRAMLRDELEQAGLKVDCAAYFFHGLYPAIMVNNLLRGRKRNVRFDAPAHGLPSAFNRILGTLFAWEARMLPKSLIGSSLIAVARCPTAT